MTSLLKTLAVGLAVAVLLAGAVVAEDFKWSWEKTQGSSTNGSPRSSQRAGTRINAAAYEELLAENVDLRKQLKTNAAAQTALKQDNAQLSRESKEMERRVRELAATITQMQLDQQKPAPVVAEEPDAATPKSADSVPYDQLAQEVATLRQVVADLKSIPKAVSGTVTPGSDIVVKLEQETVALREKIIEIDGERAKATRLVDQLSRRLVRHEERAKDEASDQRRQIGDLKRKLSEKELEVRVAAKENKQQKAQIDDLQQKVVVAENQVDELGQVTEQREQASMEEKRNLAYNLAVVHVREGRYEEAEQQYLNAVRYDPSDADSHYNLAILYDDDLHQWDKAASHYNRYLRLRPEAPDADQVQAWMMKARAQAGR